MASSLKQIGRRSLSALRARATRRAFASGVSCRAMLRPLALLSVLLLTGAAHAQVDRQEWLSLLLNHRAGGGWRYFGELQPRFSEDLGGTSQFIARAAVGKQITRDFSLWAGYGWTPNLQPGYNSEDRYFLQSLFETRAFGLSFINRTRLESRQIEGTGGSTIRFRHQLRANYRFPETSWFVFGMNEVFYNLDHAPRGPREGFEQDRLLFGVGHRFNPGMTLEGGYQAVFNGRPVKRRQDVLVVNLVLTF